MIEQTLLEQLVEALRVMPGIGRKSAQRIAHQLLQRNRDGAKHLSRIMADAMERIGHCQRCRTYTENKLCHLCENTRRDDSTICVVENPSDVDSIEETNYRGRYFVLLGHLSPLDGIGPDDIGLNEFKLLLDNEDLKEVILATSSTVEGEATAHFISEMVKASGKEVTRIAHGVPMGGELEYVNSLTIAHALDGRKAI
ncbi:MAG TPA: recombination protein RecR [Thiotrichaceae bacterium]|nr:recombination protein RecR [Thiotrichaceae bacterium]HIM08497.1 recombination protein RecR [Gammaproteobacteria bacterium]